jgi:protease-4
MSKEEVKQLADGRIFTGKQAKRAGLIDSLGTLEEAKAHAKLKAGLPDDAKEFEYRKKRRMLDWIFGDFVEFYKIKGKNPPSGLNYLFVQ